MKFKEEAQQLSKSDIFAGLSVEQIKKILPCITYQVKTYKKNEKIFTKGDIVGNIGIVLEGSLSICHKCSDDCFSAIAVIEAGQMFGEALIFASGNSIPYDVKANVNSKVLYLASDFFMRPCGAACPNKDSHGEVMRNMLRILSDRTQALNRKISYLTAPDLRSKIAMYLYDLHSATGLLSFNMPLNRDGLAEYLAVARPSLSREFINLKKRGVIDFKRSNVEILNVTELFALAHPQD